MARRSKNLDKLRDLLYGKPSDRAWEAICRLLERWPADADRSIALSYAQEHLTGWPYRFKRLPKRWLEAGLKGELPEIATIATALVTRGIHGPGRGFVNIAAALNPELLDLTDVNLSRQHEALAALHLNRLRAVKFCTNGLGKDGAALISKATWLRDLEHVAVTDNYIYDKAAVGLLKALGEPATLTLNHNYLRRKTPEALATMPRFASLKRLDLGGGLKGSGSNSIGPDGAQALAKAPHLKNLTTLNLAHNKLADGTKTLTKAAHFFRLRRLILRNNLSPSVAYHIASADHIAELQVLDLGHNKIGNDGLKALSRCKHLEHLRRLGLAACEIEGGGAATLLRSPYLKHLTWLDLAQNPIGRPSLMALTEATFADTLQTLCISHLGLDSADARLLMGIPDAFPNLHTLAISGHPRNIDLWLPKEVTQHFQRQHVRLKKVRGGLGPAL